MKINVLVNKISILGVNSSRLGNFKSFLNVDFQPIMKILKTQSTILTHYQKV